MAALASAPAAAQTVTISASGNCGGTPANCGTASNRNGDRDTTWPGLQVDEGDTITFIVTLNDPPSSGLVVIRLNRSGAAFTLADLRSSTGATLVALPTIGNVLVLASGSPTGSEAFLIAADGSAEGDEDLSYSLSISSGVNQNSAGASVGTPSSATIVVRGTDAAPSFGMGVVSAKTFTAGAAITEFTVPAASGGNGTITYAASNLPDGLIFDATGTDTNGCPGTEAREICGTPTTAAAAQTVTITATDADSNAMNTDRASLTFSATVNAGATLASSPASLTKDNLDGATLTVTLPSGFTYAAGVTAASFELVTAPTIAGLSIGAVTGGAPGTTTATLTLAAGTGYGFDAASTLAVKVLAAAHSGTGDLTTGTLPVAPAAPPGVTVSRTSLSLDEDPGTANANQGTYTVVLNSAPVGCAGGVGVSVASGNPDVEADPTALTFTATTWNTPQTVTVTAEQDDDGENDRATLRHAVTTACDAAGYPTTLAIPSVSVTVADDDAPAVTDTQPTFGEARAPSQRYVQGKEVEPLTLPGATGGNPPLTYGLSPALPEGLVWTPPGDETTGGTIAGTPAVATPAAVHTLTVTDADGDTATLAFTLEVVADARPTFGAARAPAQRYVQGVETAPLALPAATGGNRPLVYTLSPALPEGLVWTPPADETTGGTIAGTPVAVQGPVRYTLKARDADGDTAELRFTLEVVDRLVARMEGVHEAILPKLSRAMTAGTVEAVAGRIGRALDGSAPSERSAAWAEALAAMAAGGWKEGLGGRSFALGLAGDEIAGGTDVTVWGAGEYRSLSGGDAVAWDGDLFGAHLGVDTRFGAGVVAGLALSVSSGRFDYTDRSLLVRGGAVEGVYESRMTGAHPYLGWTWGEGRHAWASFGVGRGRVVVSDGEAGRRKGTSTMGSAALGGRLRVWESEGRLRVDVSGEAWTARLAVAGDGGGKASTHRLRVGAEGSREFSLGGGSLTPSVELGMRFDGGDGEKAAGMELGGGVAYAHPGLDLGAEVGGRVLAARGGGPREWSVGGALRLAPASGLGLGCGWRPRMGRPAGPGSGPPGRTARCRWRGWRPRWATAWRRWRGW